MLQLAPFSTMRLTKHTTDEGHAYDEAEVRTECKEDSP